MAYPRKPLCERSLQNDISTSGIKTEISMFYESSSLPRCKAVSHRWADESGEQFGTVEKLVLAVVSVVIAAGTLFLPIAVLHFR